MRSLFKDKIFILFFTTNLFCNSAVTFALALSSWMLAGYDDGAEIFTIAATISTIMLIFLSPFIGQLIDFFKGKNMIIASILIILIISIIIIISTGYPDILKYMLALFFIAAQIFYNIYFTARTSFIQDAFASNKHTSLIGIMETGNQLSSFIASMALIFIAKHFEYKFLFILCTIGLLLSIITMLLIPYKPQIKHLHKKLSFKDVAPFIKRLDLILITLFAYIPFVTVMMIVIILTVYFKNVLQTDIDIYALFSIVFAIGSGLAGLVFSRFVERFGVFFIIAICLIMLPIIYLLQATFPSTYILISLGFFVGFFNSTCKNAYNFYIIKTVPNNVIGTFLSFSKSIVYIMRTIASSLLFYFFFYFGEENSLYYLFIISIFGPLIYLIYIIKFKKTNY